MNSEMTTDNMSNEEVIEVLKGIVFNGFDRTTRKERQALDFAIKSLEERPQGEWIKSMAGNGWIVWGVCECSICKTKYKDVQGSLNFCPNCGAKMQKGGAE